jgi:hypothetical protein
MSPPQQASGVELTALASVLDELRAARERYRRRHGDAHATFRAGLTRAYEEELERFAADCARDGVLRPSLVPTVAEVVDYLRWLRWVGDNAAHLAALPGGTSRAAATGRAMLVYVACRLMDDGLDGHASYRGKHATLVGRLGAAGHDGAAARAQSVFWGSCLAAYALRLVDAEVATLFREVTLGALAETVIGARCDTATYARLVERKAVAYGMLLYRPMLRGVPAALREPITRALAQVEAIGQLTNDYLDEDDDRRRGQPNAVAAGLLTRLEFPTEIRVRVERVRATTRSLPAEFQDAIGAMTMNTLEAFVTSTVTAGEAASTDDWPDATHLLALLDQCSGAAVDGPSSVQPPGASLELLVQRLHRQNQYQWTEEAGARRADVSAEDLAERKRAIDRSNRQRLSLIEEIDAHAVAAASKRLVSSTSAHVNSETLGQLVDRLSILTLKLQVSTAAAQRADLADARRHAADAAAEVLTQQRAYVALCYERLLDALDRGWAMLPPTRQIKLYEEADLDRYWPRRS